MSTYRCSLSLTHTLRDAQCGLMSIIRICITLTLKLYFEPSLGVSEKNIRYQLFITFHIYYVFTVFIIIYYETNLKESSL
jgi:hypothetical protein